MNPKNIPSSEIDPKVTFRSIERPEGFDLDSAMKVALSKRSRSEAVNGFLHLAAGVTDLKEARLMRDRVLAKLASRGVAKEEWAQEVIAVLNDTIERTRGDVRAVTSKSDAKPETRPKPAVIQTKEENKAERARKEAERAKKEAAMKAEQAERAAMPGVFREVTVTGERGTQAKVELFFGYSQKGAEIVRVHAVKSGDHKILTMGSTYQLRGSNMPKNLEQAIRNAGIRITEVMNEAAQKRESLTTKQEPELTEEAVTETSEREAA